MKQLVASADWLEYILVPEDTIPEQGITREKRTAASLYPAFQALLNRSEYLRNNIDATKINSGLVNPARLPLAGTLSTGAVRIGANITYDTLTGTISITSDNIVAAFGNPNPNLFMASPSSGTAGPLSLRKIVLSDLPVVDIAHGGTGALTKTAGFDNLSPMSAPGDLILGGTAGTGTRLPGNATTTRKFLRQVGDGTNPSSTDWSTIQPSDLPAAGYAMQNTDVPFSGLTLNVIDKLVASSSNIKAVFLYDTSKDSDGGAWRNRCQNTSWYTETLNTATRGKTREFPAMALVVAETNSVIIYDATDPTLPIWMSFPSLGTGTIPHVQGVITCAFAINGTLLIGCSHSDDGLAVVCFPADRGHVVTTADFTIPGWNIAKRIGNGTWIQTSAIGFANGVVNALDARVLPTASFDPVTGLPMPTVAVATNGGVSLLKGDGTIVNSDISSSISDVMFVGEDLYFSELSASTLFYARKASSLTNGFAAVGYSSATIPTTRYANGLSVLAPMRSVAVRGNVNGLEMLQANPSTPSKGLINYTSNSYISGWQPGAIKLATLADCTAGTVSTGSNVADRSVKNMPLNVYGTLNKSAVATGADLVAYSGFSGLNYLEQPYNSGLDFGTGDCFGMGWFLTSSTATQKLMCRAAYNGSIYVGGGVELSIEAFSGKLGAYLTDDGFVTCDEVKTAQACTDGAWHFAVWCVRSGKLELWLDNTLLGSVSIVNANLGLSNSGATLRLGINQNGVTPFGGSLALFRIGAYAPTAEQIAFIYNQERRLFETDAKCLLSGSSNAVQTLAYDADTTQLIVGTGNGVSVFQGLRRVAEYNGGNSKLTHSGMTSVSGGHGAVLMAGGNEAVFIAPQRNLREEIEQKRQTKDRIRTETFTLTTGQTSLTLPTRSSKIVSVISDGAPAFENSASDPASYQIQDDGFKQTITFGASPAILGSVDVVVNYYEEK